MTNHQQISITGASGHLGTVLIQTLLKSGYKLKALYRNTPPTFSHTSLNWIQGSLDNSESLQDLLKNSSTLIHCASIISLGNHSDKEVLKVNVEGTKAVMDLCIEFGVRMIYISSSNAVQETIGETIFDELRPYKTESDFVYSYSKALAEQVVLLAVKQQNIDAFIIRPTAIVGPPDNTPSHFGTTILELAKGKIPLITSGGYNVVDNRDLCNTIVNSISLGKSGEVYLVGGHFNSVQQISKLANPSKRLIQIPINVLLWFLPIILLSNKLLKLNLPISKESLITLKNAPKNMSSKKAIQDLNHHIRPTSETITDLLDWFKTANKL